MGILSQSVIEFSTHYQTHLPPSYIGEDIETYVEEVRLQRARAANRNHQKYDDSIHGYTQPDLSTDQVIDQLTNANNRYEYSGIVETRLDIYRDGQRLFYEFISKAKDVDNSFSSYQFLYLPITEREAVSHLLPTVLTWDTPGLERGHLTPSRLYLKPLRANLWPHHYTLITDNLIHPYLGPSFVFNGRVVEQGDGSLLYEYIEVSSTYGSKGSVWISQLRPHYLDFPLGIPQENELYKDPCKLDLIGQYPSEGSFPYYGAFTGYLTTETYSRRKQFYLYERLDGSCFLLEIPPHSYSRNFIHSYMNPNTINVSGGPITGSVIRYGNLSPLYLGIEVDPSHFNRDLFRVQTLSRLGLCGSITALTFDNVFTKEVGNGLITGQRHTRRELHVFNNGIHQSIKALSKLSTNFTNGLVMGGLAVDRSSFIFTNGLITGSRPKLTQYRSYLVGYNLNATSKIKEGANFTNALVTSLSSFEHRNDVYVNELVVSPKPTQVLTTIYTNGNLYGLDENWIKRLNTKVGIKLSSSFNQISREVFNYSLLYGLNNHQVKRLSTEMGTRLSSNFNQVLGSVHTHALITHLDSVDTNKGIYNQGVVTATELSEISKELSNTGLEMAQLTTAYIIPLPIEWESEELVWGDNSIIWNEPGFL